MNHEKFAVTQFENVFKGDPDYTYDGYEMVDT